MTETHPLTRPLARVLPRTRRWWSADRADSSRAGTTVLYQALFAFAVLASILLSLAAPDEVEMPPLLLGGALVVVVTTIAVFVPWNRIAAPFSGLVPIADILIVAVLREAAPSHGFSFLWIFPAMWLASTFLLRGLLVAAVLIPVLYWIDTATSGGRQGVAVLSFLLPVTIITAATVAFVTARRAGAQRALLQDQTRRLEVAAARAREQEDFVTRVLDAVDFGVLRVDADGGHALSNRAQDRFADRLLELGDGGRALYAADGVTPIEPGCDPVSRARAGASFEHDLVWYGAPGEERIAVRVTARRVVDDGSDMGALVVTQDVTGEVLALRARDDLIASVSHELRTPLTSILGYVDLVLDDDLTPSARRGLEVIERNGTRLLEMISDILRSAQSGSPGLALTISAEPTDVAPILRAAAEAAAARAADRTLTLDVTGAEHAVAHVDGARLRQVVDNLVANAIAYHDRVDGHIWLGSTHDGDHIWIIVRDDGPGIGSEDRKHLFDRFFRAPTVRGGSAHGSGLGLSISRELVRAHGGEITVASDPGRGSSFIVRLPARREQADRDGDGQAVRL